MKRGGGAVARRSVRLLVLVLLCVQNSAHVLLLRYSRGILREDFAPSVAVVAAELLKLLVCTAVLWRQQRSPGGAVGIEGSFVALVRSAAPLSLPAAVFFAQNVLGLLATQHLDAGVFSVLSQWKILSAAIFTVLLLHRPLSPRKWRALLLLVVGVVLITLPHNASLLCPTVAPASAAEPAAQGANRSFLLGAAATLTMATLSGFGGVALERLLKGSLAASLWARNFQLSLFSIAFGLLELALFSSGTLRTQGVLHGFSLVSGAAVLTSAFGGLLVAAVLRYADNILKGYATACAIVVTSLASRLLFGAELSTLFTLGAAVVIISLFNYAEPDDAVAQESASQHVPSAAALSAPLELAVATQLRGKHAASGPSDDPSR
jgi:UDP-sugar transporter A1/2/3